MRLLLVVAVVIASVAAFAPLRPPGLVRAGRFSPDVVAGRVPPLAAKARAGTRGKKAKKKAAAKASARAPEVPPELDPAVEVQSLDDIEDLSLEQRAALKAEMTSPFRRLQQLLFGATLFGAGAGLLVSVPQFLRAAQGAEDALDATTAGQNLIINLFGVAGAFAALYFDNKRASEQLSRMEEMEKRISYRLTDKVGQAREEELKALRISVKVGEGGETRDASVGELQSAAGQHVVLVGGPTSMVEEALIRARISSKSFERSNVLVVPVFMDGGGPAAAGGAAADDAPRGFGQQPAGIVSSMELGYVACPEAGSEAVWRGFIQREMDLAETQGLPTAAKDGVVLSVCNTGKVVRRGAGQPRWGLVVDELLTAEKGGGRGEMLRLME